MTSHKSSLLRFDTEISQEEVPYLRGAIIRMVKNDSLLFHNHDGSGLRYSYPLIQYKQINGKAAILCLDDGASVIDGLFHNFFSEASLGHRKVSLLIESVHTEEIEIGPAGQNLTYKIRKWLPFNQENYKRYKNTERLDEKIAFMQNLLIGNILSLAKGLGVRFEEQVEAHILSLDEPKLYNFKKVMIMGYDAVFSTNVQLPEYAGLGKGASLGFGTIEIV